MTVKACLRQKGQISVFSIKNTNGIHLLQNNENESLSLFTKEYPT